MKIAKEPEIIRIKKNAVVPKYKRKEKKEKKRRKKDVSLFSLEEGVCACNIM